MVGELELLTLENSKLLLGDGCQSKLQCQSSATLYLLWDSVRFTSVFLGVFSLFLNNETKYYCGRKGDKDWEIGKGIDVFMNVAIWLDAGFGL